MVMILQIFVPSFAQSNLERNSENKLSSKEIKNSDDNLITIGELKGTNFSKDNPSTSLSVEKDYLNENNGEEGFTLFSTNSPYIKRNQPADADKPKYWANVKGKLSTIGLDNKPFDWNKVLGQGAKVNLLFTQTNGSVATGVSYYLSVDSAGEYTWKGSDGKATLLPLFDDKGNAYSYNIQIKKDFSKNVDLIIETENGTPIAPFRQEDGKFVATISYLNMTIKQVASTKFVSDWHTDLEEDGRPQIEGHFDMGGEEQYTNFNFPKNNTSETVFRKEYLNNFKEDEDKGFYFMPTADLLTTPKTVEVKTDTTGLTFEENNGVKTVKSGDHKFKYDFKYDVIEGGKLTMTEILPVTFGANGGKFANFTAPDTETKIVKEVDYGKDLADKPGNPTKDNESFKGWSLTENGDLLSKEDFEKATKNIKEAKTFYAIWGKASAKISYLDLDGKAIDDKFKVYGTEYPVEKEGKVDDKIKSDVYTKDNAPKFIGYKFNRVELNPKDAKYAFENQATIKIYYEKLPDVIPEKDGSGNPNEKPKGYVEVKFVPTDKAKDQVEKIFYVNPKKDVTIPIADPEATATYTFKEWKMGANADGAVYNPSAAQKFTEETTVITATYKETENIIPYDPSVPDPMVRPDGYVRVTFAADPGLKLTEQKAYYVKKNAGIKLGDAKLGKPDVNAETGYKQKSGADAWDKEDTTVIGATDIVVTAKATKLDNVISEKTGETPNKKPEGYKEVTFVIKDDDKDNGSITGVAKYYVNPNEYVIITPPTTKAETGFEFGAWDKDTTIPTIYDKDTRITGSFNGLKDVIPKTKDNDSEKPKGYVTVTFEIDGKGGKIVDGETITYFVKPNTDVTIPQPKTAADTGYEFEKWDQDTATAKKYTEDTRVKGNFKKLADIIPSKKDNGQPNAKPEGYVTVTFYKGEHGNEITGQTVYYVNPKVDPAKTLAEITKPTVKPEIGWKQKAAPDAWDKLDTLEIKGPEDIVVKAQYESIDDVVPGDQAKPEGYYTVTFVKGEHGKELTGQAVYFVNPNKAVVLKYKAPTAVPNTGYKFARWDVSIDQAIQYKDGAKITALYNEPGNISTTEVEGYVKVEFKPGNNGSLTGTTNYWVKPGVEVNVPAPTVKPNIGYKFDKWNKKLTVTLEIKDSPYEITAQYQALENIIPGDQTKPEGYVTVTFDKGDHGTLSGTTVYYVNPDANPTKTLADITTKPTVKAETGFKFTGWDTEDTIQIKKNITVKAEYEALPDVIPAGNNVDQPKGYVKVEFIAGANGSLEGGDKTYFVNPLKGIKVDSTELPIPKPTPDTNYEFDGWYETINKKEQITNDKTFVARFKLNKVTITYVATDATAGTVPQALSYDIGTEITLAGGNDLKKDNYSLTGWKIDGTVYKPGTTFTINKDTKAEAVWEASFHTVNFNTDGGGYIASQKVKHNELITQVKNPKKVNYTFTGWKVDGQDFDPATSNVTKDITLVAQYVSNVVEQIDPNTKPEVPKNFVKVIVKTTEDGIEKATEETKFEKTFWVNPTKKVTIPVKDPVGKEVDKADGTKDFTWLFEGWDKKLTQQFTDNETTITAKYKKGYELPEVKPIPEANGGFIYTDLGKKITEDQYKKGITLPNGYSFDKGTRLEIVESTKPNVNKSGRYNVAFWVTYPDGKAQKVEVIVYVGEARPEPKPPTPEPGYPGGPDYPYYPGRPIPMYPEVRYETIIQEKIVKVPVPVSDNYFKEVRYMQGFNGYFRPNDGLTRAEAAQILANALVEDGYKYNPNFKISYKDIGEAWYTRAVKIVTEANVFAGYDDGNFKPQAKITRNEWIATLKRFQELGDASGNNMKLSDNHWAKGEIQAAFNEGWLKIYTDGLATYKGDEFIPRQEVAAVSNKAFKRIVDKTYIGKNNLSLVTYKDVNTSMWAYEDILCASNTFLDRKDRYIAHWVKEDKNQFNIDTSDLKIVQKNFQRNPR